MTIKLQHKNVNIAGFVEIYDDLVQGVFQKYCIGRGVDGQQFYTLEEVMAWYKFPESAKESSRMLNWLKENDIVLYKEIVWY